MKRTREQWDELYQDHARGMVLGMEYLMEHFDIERGTVAQAISNLAPRPGRYDISMHPQAIKGGI